MSTTTAPSEMDLVAATLVERFLNHGGDVGVTAEGKLSCWFPEPGIGRRPEQDTWQRGFTDGAYRELWALIDHCKPLREAVKQFIQRYPSSITDSGGVWA